MKTILNSRARAILCAGSIMRSLRIPLASIAALFILLSAVGNDVFAQWSHRASVGHSHFVKMLDEVGKPHVGFIGREVRGLMMTTDSGHTWTNAQIDPPDNAEIFDLDFKDGLTGWAVGRYATYKTTDGGYHWTQCFNAQGVSVEYIRSTNSVILSSWNVPAQISTDEGATWQSFAPTEMNGFTSMDDSHVFFTPHAGIGRLTTDGGRSWEESSLTTEIWQPASLKQRRWYIGVSEKTGDVLRSTDLGYTWTRLTGMYNPTGCVRGNDSNLIAQTMMGMMRSTDQGSNWHYICGPSKHYDTRFWVDGLKIYALTNNGELYYNPTSRSGVAGNSVAFSRQNIVLFTDGCNKPSAKLTITSASCGARLVGVSIEGDPEITLGSIGTPAEFFGSIDIPIQYLPTDPDDDSAIVRVSFDLGGVQVDTMFKVYGKEVRLLSASNEPPTVQLKMGNNCRIDEKKAKILNTGCDPFTIDSFQLADTLHFDIVGLNVPFSLASRETHEFSIIAKRITKRKHEAILTVFVHNDAGSKELRFLLKLDNNDLVQKPLDAQRYAFNTTCEPARSVIDFTNVLCDTIYVDSIRLANTVEFRLLPLSFPQSLSKDQKLSIPYEIYPPKPGPASSRVTIFYRLLGQPFQQLTWLYASNRVQVVLPSDTVDFTASGSCPDFDSAFSITNILCDSIKIISMKPAFQPTFTISVPQLPLDLGPNGKAQIGVSTDVFFRGKTGTSIAIRYEAYGRIYDTIVYVSVRNLKNFTIDPKLSRLNFGRTSVCAPQQRTVYVANNYCMPVTIERARWSTATSARFSLSYSPVIPRVLQPGERDSFIVQFAPDATGSRTGALEVRMKSAVVTLDTFFTVDGIGTGSINANLRDEQLPMGTALTCEKLSQQTVIRNDGCVDLDLVSVYHPNGAFRLLSPSLPHSLAPGDTAIVTFETATTLPGNLAEKVILRMLSKQNIEQLIECDLSATLIKEPQRILATSLALGELNGCAPLDTSITIRNPNQCESVTVTGEFSTTDATIIGNNVASIPPGGSATFRIRITPNTNASVALRLYSNEFDTTVTVNYSFTSGGGELTSSGPTATYSTNACDTLSKTYLIENRACEEATISAIRIVGAGGNPSKFSLLDALQLPIDLSGFDKVAVRVVYDPKAQGVDAATLEIESDGVVLTHQLVGESTPVQSIGATLTSAGMREVIVGDEIEVELALTNDIASPIAIEDLRAQFGFDTDMLTLTQVVPHGAWSIAAKNDIAGGASLQLVHPNASFVANSPMATLKFRSALARDVTGSITLESLVVTSVDPRFSECVANTVFDPSANDVTLKYYCGGETLRSLLNDNFPVKNITVHPHPASSADKLLTVSFELAANDDATLEMINVLGSSLSKTVHAGQAGMNEVQIPLSGISSGWHLLRIRTPMGVAGVRVLIAD